MLDFENRLVAFDESLDQRWLFCMTHPDDELAIAAWIRHLRNRGVEVFMSWTHDTPVRVKEACDVAFQLRVPRQNLFFHHGPDGQILEQIEKLLPQFSKMVDVVKPTRIVSVAFEQGHLDHDATNYIVNQVFAGPVFEIPLYHTYRHLIPKMNVFARPDGEEVRYLDLQDQAFKAQIAKMYPSQKIWRNIFWYEVWQGIKLKPRVLNKVERMRLQTHRDFLTPNLSHKFAKKVKKSNHWRRWESVINSINR